MRTAFPSKKHKASHDRASVGRLSNDHDHNVLSYTSKPSAVFAPTGGRSHTVSVALPGSIIANAQSLEQKTLLAGAVARALAVFCVDEVVIFEDDEAHTSSEEDVSSSSNDADDHGYCAGHVREYTAYSNPSHFLVHLLSYLETPPYLRKHLFPMHPNLRTAGLLPSLDMPHHLRANEWCDYREGIVVSAADQRGRGVNQCSRTNTQQSRKRSSSDTYDGDVDSDENSDSHALVDTGLSKKITVPATSKLPKHARITVRLARNGAHQAQPVDPSTPRAEAGYYWGYGVRRCHSLSAVFTECPFDGGYDLSFGTSERGASAHRVLEDDATPLPQFKHLLVVFGGVGGIEAAVGNDPDLQDMEIRPADAEKLFDYWVNFLPGQGSRTIRTEEAVWLGLTSLRGVVQKK